MEPINSRCELITCECGGKFQRKALTKHAGTKMHINFRLKREAEETIMHIKLTPEEEDEECHRQEIEDIKEQEIRDNSAEVETWKAEDIQRTKEEAEEDARLDAEYEAWAVEWDKGRLVREEYEAWYEKACSQGYKDRSRTAADDLVAMLELREKAGGFRAEVPPPEKIEPAVIPGKKSYLVKIQVSKEFKTMKERKNVSSWRSVSELTKEERGGNFGRFRSAPEVFEQPGFRNS